MRVRGNASPSAISVWAYPSKPGYVEVRLRENVTNVTRANPTTGQPATMFEYDEYTFVLEERDGLEADIQANMADWLATGREMEYDNNASAVRDMLEENQRLAAEKEKAESTVDAMTAAYQEGVASA